MMPNNLRLHKTHSVLPGYGGLDGVYYPLSHPTGEY